MDSIPAASTNPRLQSRWAAEHGDSQGIRGFEPQDGTALQSYPVLGFAMRRVERIAGWLCLVLMLLTGAVPAQSFVLCIEADGCVTLEALDARGACGGCESHEREPEKSGEQISPAVGTACPCVDVTVAISIRDSRVQPKGSSLAELVPPALPVPFVLSGAFPSLARAFRPPPERALAADRLPLIRSVVLLV